MELVEEGMFLSFYTAVGFELITPDMLIIVAQCMITPYL